MLAAAGLPVSDDELDRQVEQFPLVVLAYDDGELQGLLLGSLERIGGTPSILWGAGAARRNKLAPHDVARDDGRTVASRRDLVPRRGRARRDAAAQAERVHVVADVREHRAPTRLYAERRRPRVGSPARQAIRFRQQFRRPDVPRSRSRAASRRACRSSMRVRSRPQVEPRSSRSSASSKQRGARRSSRSGGPSPRSLRPGTTSPRPDVRRVPRRAGRAGRRGS